MKLSSTHLLTRLLTIALAIPCSNVFAQQFLVRSADDSSAIAYANVLFAKNDSIINMAYSDEMGQVTAATSGFTKIIISHVAYKELILDGGQVPGVVYLLTSENVLQEVDVKATKKPNIVFLGKKPKVGEKTSVSWSCKLNSTHQNLVLMQNPFNEDKKIKSFVLYTKFYSNRKSDYLVRILFFENNKGQLGKQVPLDKVHKLTKGDKGRVVVDLENSNLTLPKEGYFIGLEMIGCVNTEDNSSPGIVFHIEKNLTADSKVVERSRTTTHDWYDWDAYLKDSRLEMFQGYFVPAFGLEIFE